MVRLTSYRMNDGALRAGVIVEDSIIDVARAGRVLGLELSSDLLATLNQEGDGLSLLQRVAATFADGSFQSMPLAEVTLGPVLPRPPKILLLAGNYQSHVTEGGGAPLNKNLVTPRFFMKPPSSVVGTGDAIKIPRVSEKVDYEIEIAAVIGRRGRDIPLEEAEEYVLGYTVFNDISARELKVVGHRMVSNPQRYAFFDWLIGKWCDTFAIIGPCLVTRDEIADVKKLNMALRVNGELRQHSSAGEMIFSVPEAIAWISSFVTLEPGDLICMGTPGGVGETIESYLRPGDVVEAEIEHLGRLVNHVE